MTAAKRDVKVGPVIEDKIEIFSGLKGEEWIATSGVHQLKQGMKVRRLEEKRQ